MEAAEAEQTPPPLESGDVVQYLPRIDDEIGQASILGWVFIPQGWDHAIILRIWRGRQPNGDLKLYWQKEGIPDDE